MADLQYGFHVDWPKGSQTTNKKPEPNQPINTQQNHPISIVQNQPIKDQEIQPIRRSLRLRNKNHIKAKTTPNNPILPDEDLKD